MTSENPGWFRPRRVPAASRLLHALPANAPTAPPPPGPPSVEAIVALVRTYGEVMTDAAVAFRNGEDVAYRQAEHRAEGLFELIEHNISTLDGWITGYRLVLSDLQKGTQS